MRELLSGIEKYNQLALQAFTKEQCQAIPQKSIYNFPLKRAPHSYHGKVDVLVEDLKVLRDHNYSVILFAGKPLGTNLGIQPHMIKG